MKIKILKREDIEDKVWNGCVHFAHNPRPYGYTWYLDNICENWEGMVLGNYHAVFPLVFNRKFGIDYLFQPFFAQQLGIFSRIGFNEALFTMFFENIPEKYKYIDIYLNEMNEFRYPDYELTPRVNLLLNLNKSYETLFESYSKNLKRNLKKADKHKLHITAGISPERMVELFKNNPGSKVKALKDKEYHTLHRVIHHSIYYGVGQVIGVLNENRELISAGFFIFDKKRIYNILPASNAEGKEKCAMHHLINYIILSNAGTKKTLDFEGSMIESIANFFKSFGAEETRYWHLKRNILPWYLKMLKN
ncbi:MAG: hypothetical protein EA412_07145 [Chitinophagaceae bacterium]|nr:MAG: hypothetical protein EA412_07145 [Chitinophagaceae bacterium]